MLERHKTTQGLEKLGARTARVPGTVISSPHGFHTSVASGKLDLTCCLRAPKEYVSKERKLAISCISFYEQVFEAPCLALFVRAESLRLAHVQEEKS